MTDKVQSGSAQYPRVLTAKIPASLVVSGTPVNVGQLPGNAFLEELNINNAAFTGGLASTLKVALTDLDDGTDVLVLDAALDVHAGGRVSNDQSGAAKVAVVTNVTVTPTTDATAAADIEVYLRYFTEDTADESLE